MFEIRVAVMGYVSVGKTTVINAMFGSEYGEVSMRRTTAVVNSFRVSSPASTGSDCNAVKSESSQSEQVSEDDSMAVVSKRFTAKATLQESKADNATFRNSDVVKEKTFDICVEEPIHEMRDDTKLVIVDIPGINEAGTSSKYKDYVDGHWHTFDVAVVVLDARQGVNTDEQHKLLDLVKQNLAKTKDIPVVLVFNKVDDPYNKEQQALLDEARKAVSEIFGVSERESALKRLKEQMKTRVKAKFDRTMFPAVVPMSAMHAFVYRCGARLSFDEFCEMDQDFVENLGKECYGRQWHRFNEKKKLEMAYEAVSDEAQRLDGIEASNYDCFMNVLSYAIGDNDRQKALIGYQANIAIKRLKQGCQEVDFGAELLAAHTKLKALGQSTVFLPGAFWTAFGKLKKKTLDNFSKDFSPVPFSFPVKHLLVYQEALATFAFDGELQKVVSAAKELILLYAVTVVNSEKMKSLNESEFFAVIGCMLLNSSDTAFNFHFGHLKIWLDSQYISRNGSSDVKRCITCREPTQHYSSYNCDRCKKCNKYYIGRDELYCPRCRRNGYTNNLSITRDSLGETTGRCNSSCSTIFYILSDKARMNLQNGRLVQVDDKGKENDLAVNMPDSLEDPSHFGHVIWLCCQLLKKAEA